MESRSVKNVTFCFVDLGIITSQTSSRVSGEIVHSDAKLFAFLKLARVLDAIIIGVFV